MFKKYAVVAFGLTGIMLSPFLFEPLSNLIQSHAPDRFNSDWWVYHFAFWLLSFVWAAFFGLWVWKSEWSWFTTGDPRKKFVLLLALAVLFRLAVVVSINLPPTSDAAHYDLLAQNLAQTGRYEENGQPTAFRPVGYPAFLAGIYRIFGHNLFLPKLANVLFDLLTILLLWKLFTRWKNEATSLKAVAIYAFFVPEVYSTQYLLAEQLFVFLWVTSIFFWETAQKRNRRPLFSGFFFGLSALVRPVVLAWAVVPVLTGLAKKRWMAPAGFLFLALAVTAPWVYRNHQKLGIRSLSAHAGINFWMGANPNATGWYQPLDTALFDTSDQAQLDRTGWRLGWEFVRSHPWQYLKLGLAKEAVLFGLEHNFVFDLYEAPTHGQLVWGILGQAYWWILLFFGTLKGAAILFSPKNRAEAGSLLPLWTLVYWAAVHFFFVGATRYHHPVVPFFAFLAALPLLRKAESDRLQVAEGYRPPVKN